MAAFHIPPALKHRKFVLLWLGLMISQAGSQMQIWALFWHISTLSSNPIAVSVIGAIRFVPVVLFSLLAGLVADRYNRRKIVFLTQITATLVAIALGVLTMTHTITLWYIYALTAIQAAAIAFDLPARQSLIPSLLPPEDLPSAFSLQSIAFNMGSIVGPGLSGIIIAYYGQEYTYYLNAVSFIAVIVALILMGHVSQPAPQNAMSIKNSLGDIRAGIRFIRNQPIIISSMVLDFIATFFSSANTLLPYLAHSVLHVDAIIYGWLAAAQSIGAVTAGVIISQLSDLRRQGTILLAAVGAFGLITILFGLSTWVDLTFLTLIGIGAADTVSTVIRNTVRQMQTPDAMRGRMTGINQIFFMGGPQLGEIEAGAVAQAFGVPFAIISGGIGTILGAWLIVLRWPQLLKYDHQEPQPAAAPAD